MFAGLGLSWLSSRWSFSWRSRQSPRTVVNRTADWLSAYSRLRLFMCGRGVSLWHSLGNRRPLDTPAYSGYSGRTA
jgi:hypothetical protein